jgi:hypothetical protein
VKSCHIEGRFFPSAFRDLTIGRYGSSCVLEGVPRAHHLDDLLAHGAHQRLEVRVLQQLAAAHAGERRDRVHDGVVDELLPHDRLDVLDHLGRHAGARNTSPIARTSSVIFRSTGAIWMGLMVAVAHPVGPVCWIEL